MRRILVLLVMAGLAAGCATTPSTQPATGPATLPPPPRILTVVTHDSFSVSATVLAKFEMENNAKVQFVKAGDAGTMLNKAILAKDNPLGDVMYGVDNTYLSRALDEGIFEPYNSPQLAQIPSGFNLDPQDRALPVDYGDVCLNYDRTYFTQHNLTPPASLQDLTRPEYKSLLVVEDPATSSPGLAFLVATVGVFGDPGYLDYWKQLRQNDVRVVEGWEAAYNTEFSGSSGRGPRPIVVSYSSSPAFEVVNATTPVTESPTAAVVADNTCFRQVEFVGILKGTKNRDLAERWVDFMLSTTFQEDMPLQMYVFPVNARAKLDPVFQKWLVEPGKLAQVSPELISANRDKWISAWREVVLR